MLRGTGGHGKTAVVGKSQRIDRLDTRKAEIMTIGIIDGTSTGTTDGTTTGMIDDTTTRTTDGLSPGTTDGTIARIIARTIDAATNEVIGAKADDNDDKMCSLENGG